MVTAANTIDTMQKMPSRFKSIPQWIWAATLIISAVIFLSNAMRIQRIHASAAWPTVSGVIEISELEYTAMSRTINKYQLHIAYRYTVDGIPYQNQRVSYVERTSFVGRTSGERYVKRVLAEYPKGASVTVHHHPKDPGLAVLETQIPDGSIKALILGLGMTLLSLIGLWRRWSLQSDYLFKPLDPDAPMTAQKFILGALGLAVCLGIALIWWELIKMYAGR